MNRSRRGVTLMEMLVVVALLALLVGVSFPSISSGVDALRLRSASDSIVTFLNSALNRAQRRQQVTEVTISKPDNALSMRSTEPGFTRELRLPEGISVAAVLPEIPMEPDAPRHFMLYPGGTVPQIGVEIANRRGARRIVRVDAITGVARVEAAAAQ